MPGRAARRVGLLGSDEISLADQGRVRGMPGDGHAVLLYDMTLPVGDLRIAEYFTVGDGRITQITHIHDTAALRAAGAG